MQTKITIYDDSNNVLVEQIIVGDNFSVDYVRSPFFLDEKTMLLGWTFQAKVERLKEDIIIICPIHGNKKHTIEPTHFCMHKIPNAKNGTCNCVCTCNTLCAN